MNHRLNNARTKTVQFLQKRFVRNVITVASGTAAAQAITMAFSPFITRIYGPEAFGLLGVFASLLSILIPISALTYPIAIVLPEDDADAEGLVKISFRTALVISLAIALMLLTAKDWLLTVLDLKAIAPYIMLLPLSMLFSASRDIGQQWLIRKKQYAIQARVAVLYALLLNSAKTSIGYFKPFGATLIILATLGYGVHAAMLWMGIRQTGRFTGNTDTTGVIHKPLKQIAVEYRDFPFYRTPQVFINAVSQNLPVLMLSGFFGPASVGAYTICKSVLNIPSQLIGKSVADVFYPRVTEAAHDKEDVSKLISKATVALAAVGIIPFALVVMFGPSLFCFVFGAEWGKAGEYARWLALWMFFAFLNRPSVAAIPVLDMQGFFLIHELISIGARSAALAAGFFIFKNDATAIALFALTGMLLNFMLILRTLVKAKSLREAVKP